MNAAPLRVMLVDDDLERRAAVAAALHGAGLAVVAELGTADGLLRAVAGCTPDVVIIDPATVNAGSLERVYDQPAGQDRLISKASGIDAVIVNGTVLRRNGEDVVQGAALPGQLLRRGVNA